MKNSILFYTLLVLLVFGGVRWTAYSLYEEKKDVIDRHNLIDELRNSLIVAKEPIANELKGKKVLLYNWDSECEHCAGDLPKLNKLAKEHKELLILGVLEGDKEKAMASYRKRNIEPKFPVIVDEIGWLDRFMVPISQVYGVASDPRDMKDRRPELVLIDIDGKVKLYSVGQKGHLFEDLEESLNISISITL